MRWVFQNTLQSFLENANLCVEVIESNFAAYLWTCMKQDELLSWSAFSNSVYTSFLLITLIIEKYRLKTLDIPLLCYRSEKKSKKSKKEKHAPKEDDLLGLDEPVQEQSADPKLTTSSVQVDIQFIKILLHFLYSTGDRKSSAVILPFLQKGNQ